jgi:hypothetical protein
MENERKNDSVVFKKHVSDSVSAQLDRLAFQENYRKKRGRD